MTEFITFDISFATDDKDVYRLVIGPNKLAELTITSSNYESAIINYLESNSLVLKKQDEVLKNLRSLLFLNSSIKRVFLELECERKSFSITVRLNGNGHLLVAFNTTATGFFNFTSIAKLSEFLVSRIFTPQEQSRIISFVTYFLNNSGMEQSTVTFYGTDQS